MAIHPPLGSSNTEVDLLTGEPLAAKKKVDKITRENEAVERGTSLQHELSGHDGRVLIEFILQSIERKIDIFLQSDPECSTLLKLLTELNYTANIGRRRAISKLHDIMGDDTPSWLFSVK